MLRPPPTVQHVIRLAVVDDHPAIAAAISDAARILALIAIVALIFLGGHVSTIISNVGHSM